jgi:hypothetical protein
MHWRTVRGGRVMSDDDHIAQLMKGVAAWNTWRDENPHIHPDLGGGRTSPRRTSAGHTSARRASLQNSEAPILTQKLAGEWKPNTQSPP